MTNLDQNNDIEVKYASLPDNVKEAISSVDSANKIQAIAKKYKLHIDQTGELGTQVGLVMLGILAPRDFVAALAKELALTPELARSVATEVNEQIFTPIRDSLKKIHHLEPGTTETPEVKAESPISSFMAKTTEPTLTNKEKTVLTPADLASRPKKDFDPYKEPIE